MIRRVLFELMARVYDLDGEFRLIEVANRDPLAPELRQPGIRCFDFFDYGYSHPFGDELRSYIRCRRKSVNNCSGLAEFHKSENHYVGRVITVDQAVRDVPDLETRFRIAQLAREDDNRLILYTDGVMDPYDEGDIVIEPGEGAWPEGLLALL